MSDFKIEDTIRIEALQNELAEADLKVKACSSAMADAIKEKQKFAQLVRSLMQCYLETEDKDEDDYE